MVAGPVMLGAAVGFDVAAEVAFDYLVDPRNRPEWQSSLRRVDVLDEEIAVGQPGSTSLHSECGPQMRTSVLQRPEAWAETGTWRGVEALLLLVFEPRDLGCRVNARVRVKGRNLWRPLGPLATLAAGVAVPGDLKTSSAHPFRALRLTLGLGHTRPQEAAPVYNLSILLEDTARRYPDRDALVLGDTRLTYAQVDGMANQVANLLVERGMERGDKVALTCPNLPYFPVVYYGILKAGGVVVPMNVLLKGREVAYHLGDSDVKAYFCFQGTPELPMGAEGYAGVQHAVGQPSSTSS